MHSLNQRGEASALASIVDTLAEQLKALATEEAKLGSRCDKASLLQRRLQAAESLMCHITPACGHWSKADDALLDLGLEMFHADFCALALFVGRSRMSCRQVFHRALKRHPATVANILKGEKRGTTVCVCACVCLYVLVRVCAW